MGYPVWITPAGDLGKIAELEYYRFTVSAAESNGQAVAYSLIAGRLPSGIQLTAQGTIAGQPAESYVNIAGTPAAVNIDRDFKFTVRATANNDSNQITDRTFNLTITGNKDPVILTDPTFLGTFLDGTEIDIQLEALDLDGDPLIWNFKDGKLPDGVFLSETGALTGYIRPVVNLPEGSTIGWDKSRWEQYPWEFSTKSISLNYEFAVEVSDKKSYVSKSFSFLVLSHDSLRADNTLITTDSNILTADLDEKRPPILLTDDMGLFSIYKSDNYFAFKFDAIDSDGDAVGYTILSGDGIGFDQAGANFDTTLFDRGNLSLPPGLSLNQTTGWLTGYIPVQIETTKDYKFAIQAYKVNNSTYVTSPKLFTLTILGSLNLNVTWITPNDLGLLDAGEISKIQIIAETINRQNLSYSLKIGSRLPQGLKLLSDGVLSGRCSFQTFGLDSGTTTFDKTLAAKSFTTGETFFDRTYRFTVIAANADNSINTERTFSLVVDTLSAEPYESVYLRCLPAIAERNKLYNIIDNTDIFPNQAIYRLNDPYWGKNRTLDVLAAYGLTASSAADYIAAMEDRHYNKTLYFGNYGTSLAKDENENVLYEVIWVDIIEDTSAYVKGTKQNSPAASTDIRSKINNWRNPAFGIDDPAGYTLKINDVFLAQRDLVTALGQTNPSALPEWMISVQEDKTTLGFTTKAVLAYVKPGEGKKILFRLNRATQNNTLPDIKEIFFTADRYVLDNNLSEYFNLDTRLWQAHNYTSFDLEANVDDSYNPVATVDFAVNIPFEYINGKTTQQVEALGGLDNIITSFEGRTIIFATQENYTGFNYQSENQGWVQYNQFFDDTTDFDGVTFDKSTVVTGYVANQGNPDLVNKRAGVWTVTKDENNLFKLIFTSAIAINQVVEVRFGSQYGGNKLIYNFNLEDGLATVPNFNIINPFAVFEPIPTTFDQNTTRFLNAVDIYQLPDAGDRYLKFPSINIMDKNSSITIVAGLFDSNLVTFDSVALTFDEG